MPTPNLRNFDLNLLLVFDAVLSERSVTQAAEKIGLSQPATSNALGRLRDLLDDPLFVRTKDEMKPTPRAQQLAEPIRQALDLVQTSLQETTEFDYRSSDRTFTFSAPDYAEVVILPRLVNRMSRMAPGISIKTVPAIIGEREEALHLGKADLMTDYIPISGEEFESRVIMKEPIVTIAAQDHPEVGDTLSLDQYLDLRHVIYTPRMEDGTVVQQKIEEIGADRNVVLQAPSLTSMPIIVAQTSLFATLPLRVVRAAMDLFEPERFGLQILETPLDLDPVPFYQMWHQSRTSDKGHRWVRDSMRDQCQRL